MKPQPDSSHGDRVQGLWGWRTHGYQAQKRVCPAVSVSSSLCSFPPLLRTLAVIKAKVSLFKPINNCLEMHKWPRKDQQRKQAPEPIQTASG